MFITHEQRLFENTDYSEQIIANHEFIGCTFKKCIFLTTNLTNNSFMDCVFEECNFSGTLFDNSSLKNITFKNCKVMGINFGKCADFLFSVAFEGCMLDYSSFFQKKMKKTQFKDCSMKEVTFSEVDLSESVFQNCDLLDASFVKTNLEKVDFRTATHYAFDPEKNTIKLAKFSRGDVIGLLAKYPIVIE